MLLSVEAERVFPLELTPFSHWVQHLNGVQEHHDDYAYLVTPNWNLGGEFNRAFLKSSADESDIEACIDALQEHDKYPSFTISAYSEGNWLGQRLAGYDYAPEASIAVMRRTPETFEPDLPNGVSMQTVSLNTLPDFARLNQRAFPGTFGLLAPSDVARVHEPLLDSDSWSLNLAWVRDHPASFSLFYSDDRVGYYIGAGTQEQFQDRNLHTALIRSCLNEADENGLSTIYAWAQAGSASQRNLERCGFQLIDFYQHWG